MNRSGQQNPFPVSTEKVYCFMEKVDSNSKRYGDFFCLELWGERDDKTTLPLKAGAKWRTCANKNLRGLKGEWKVEIKDSDGKVLKDVKFKVK